MPLIRSNSTIFTTDNYKKNNIYMGVNGRQFDLPNNICSSYFCKGIFQSQYMFFPEVRALFLQSTY